MSAASPGGSTAARSPSTSSAASAWYTISGLIVLVSIDRAGCARLNFSVDFKGGSVFEFPATAAPPRQGQIRRVSGTAASTSTAQLFSLPPVSARNGRIQTKAMERRQQNVAIALEHNFHTRTARTSSRRRDVGQQITTKSIEALIVFLVVIASTSRSRSSPRWRRPRSSR